MLHTAKALLLDDCAHHVAGRSDLYGSNCPGSGNVAPSHTLLGTIEIGQTVQFVVAQARPQTSGIMMIGTGATQLSLSAIGMGTCTLLVTGNVNLPIATTANGTGTVPVTLPLDRALIAATIYSQAAVVDLGTATPMKLTTTNGRAVFIGGLR